MTATVPGAHPVTYLGDAASAAAFALAGLQAHAPAPGEERAAFARACEDSRLVLLGTRIALALPQDALDKALAGLAPLVAIVPDAADDAALPDAAARARRQLGLD